MSEWGVVTVIIALVGLVGVFVKALWPKERLIALVENDPPRLTVEEYQKITGEVYST